MLPNLETDLFFFTLIQNGTLTLLGFDKVLCSNGKVLAPRIPNWNDYVRLGYSSKSIVFHRFVWLAYNGLIPAKIQINHKDGDKRNNKITNLELVTNSENLKHAVAIGLTIVSPKVREGRKLAVQGELYNMSKFSDLEIIELRKAFSNGVMSKKAIALKCGVGVRTVTNFLNGSTYAHLESAPLEKGKSGRPNTISDIECFKILDRLANGELNYKLAKEYGVDRSTLSKRLVRLKLQEKI